MVEIRGADKLLFVKEKLILLKSSLTLAKPWEIAINKIKNFYKCDTSITEYATCN